MKKQTLIIVIIIMLIFLITRKGLTQELDRDQIKVFIRVGERIEVEFEDKALDLDLAGGVSSEMLFKVFANSPLTVSFESVEGFGEEINDLFEYVVVYTEEGEEKEEVFQPGSYLPTGVIEMEPGKKDWKLIIRLREDIAEQWQLLLDEGIENVETIEMGTEWTALEPGEYTDYVNMTFHRQGIDRHIMERFD